MTCWGTSAVSDCFSSLLSLFSITVLQILSPYCCSVFHSWQMKSWEQNYSAESSAHSLDCTAIFYTIFCVCVFFLLSSHELKTTLLMLFLFCQCFVGISATLQLALIRPDWADAKNFHRNSRLKFRSMPLLCSRGINYAWICQLQWVSKHCPTQSSVLHRSYPPFLLPAC